jgi:hypothetical protein
VFELRMTTASGTSEDSGRIVAAAKADAKRRKRLRTSRA